MCRWTTPAPRPSVALLSGSTRTIERRPRTRVRDDDAPPLELVESKLAIPFTRKGIVPRPALVERLRASSSVPVVAVLAPPGYGKTTLLFQWAEADDRPFAWVSLDRRDNDPKVLLTYVAVALDRIEPLAPALYAAMSAPGASIREALVPRLGAALAAITRPLVLVLDDVHLLRDRDGADALTTLVEHLPAGSQMAIAGRGTESLPIGRLRADGRVLEMGTRDLALDVRDASSLVRSAGVQITRGQMRSLVDQTEGWPVGLYLAALSIKAGGRGPSSAAAFAGDDRFIADYIRSEFLENLSRTAVSFLTRTSVLDALSGSLCDAVLERSGSAKALRSMERKNLLLLPLDREGTWYRYHHLFRDLLRAELNRREPDLGATLLGRAAAWCEENGRPEDALEYAQEAGDAGRAARLLPSIMLPAHNDGRLTTIRTWLAWFADHDLIGRYPAVDALGAGVLALMGEAAEADRWIAAAKPAERGSLLPDGVTPYAALLAIVRAVMCAEGARRVEVDAAFARDQVPEESPWRATALLVHGIANLLTGRDVEAEVDLEDAIEVGERSGSPDTAAVALCELAMVAMARGKWGDALRDARRAASIVHRAHLEEYVTSAMVHAVRARLALHQGDLAGAHRDLVSAQRLRPRLTYALPWMAVQVRLELARAYLSLADRAGARTMVREADEIVRRRPDLGVLGGELDDVRRQIDSGPATPPGMSTLTTAELRLLPYLPTHLTFPEISERLFLSRHTIKTQAISIYRKLCVSSRSEAIQQARDLGLIGP
jgi:LuxR family transcriptional regulator, maltose regulon positive regulatory protein